MTMLCDQTTRSKLATRQPNDRTIGIVSLTMAASGGNARAFRIHGSFCHENDVDISVVSRMFLLSGVE